MCRPSRNFSRASSSVGGFVIGAHAGERVGVEIFSAQTGRVAVNALALAGVNFRQFAFRAEKNAGKIHQLGHARDAFVGNHQLQIVRRKICAGSFQMRRGNAARQHDEKIQRQIFGGFENVADAVETENVRVFVRVNHDRARAVRDDGAREFRRGEHGTFDVKMPVNQARREICALEVNGFFRAIIAEADDAAVVHGDVRGMDFAAQDVDEPSRF